MIPMQMTEILEEMKEMEKNWCDTQTYAEYRSNML